MKSSHISLFWKFVVAFISVGLLPILFIGIYSGSQFRQRTYSMMSDSYHQITIYSVQNLENMVEKYNNITKLLYSYNPEHVSIRVVDGLGLARMLANNGNEVEILRKRSSINAFLRVVNASDNFIRNTSFIEEDGTVHYYARGGQNLTNRYRLIEVLDHNNSHSRTNQLILIPTHTDNYFRGNDNNVFTVGRNYLNLARAVGEENILGTLYMDVDIRAIDDIFKQMEIYQTSEIIVTDEFDRIIYANPTHYLWQEQNFSPHPDNLIELYERSDSMGWQVLIRSDYGSAMGRIVDLINLIYILVAGVLIALLVISILYSRAFLKPIHAVLLGMKQVEAGNFDADIQVKTKDEMGQLAEGFNSMSSQLKEHIETVYLTQLRRKEAELGALKMQINPHYLYNSLEIIQMNAIANDDESTADLVLLLADQMRYSLGRIGEIAQLSREFEILRSYFAFIDIRYDNRIKWEISEDEDLKESQVLSLIIQPIVENAVIHGLKPKGGGHLHISTERRGNDMAITIMDNGVGIDEEKVTSMMEQLERDDNWNQQWTDTDSIGLKNVHDRLRYKYGKPYGVTVSSQLQIGTSVTLLLPINGKEDGNV